MTMPVTESSSRSAVTKSPRRHWPLPCLLPPLVSSLALWLCYFPMGWGWLAWVALVPFLLLARADARPRTIFLCSYLGGVCFFIPALLWMTVADYRMYATWAALSLYCALYFPVAIFLIRRFERVTAWPLFVTAPLVWTGLEFIRSYLLTGFAWYYLGHTQHRYLAMIQVADLGGVYAISFLVAMANAWIAECLLRIPDMRLALRLLPAPGGDDYRLRRVPLAVKHGLILGSLILAALLYGGFRLNQETFRPGPRVALLQGNLDQRIRNDLSSPTPSEDNMIAVGRHYDQLCLIALQSQPDLIVWPETSYHIPWYDSPRSVAYDQKPQDFREYEAFIDKKLREYARDVTRVHHLSASTLKRSTRTSRNKDGIPPCSSTKMANAEADMTRSIASPSVNMCRFSIGCHSSKHSPLMTTITASARGTS